MALVKESRKEFDNLFEDEKAILDFEEKHITLTKIQQERCSVFSLALSQIEVDL